MNIMQSLKSFESELHLLARQLKEKGVPTNQYHDDSGRIVNGWFVEHEDFPTYEDVMPGRRPYYMGGHWGRMTVFLGEDGKLWKHIFRGSDTYNSAIDEIENTQSNCIEQCSMGELLGSERPFKTTLEKVHRAVLKVMDQHSA